MHLHSEEAGSKKDHDSEGCPLRLRGRALHAQEAPLLSTLETPELAEMMKGMLLSRLEVEP